MIFQILNLLFLTCNEIFFHLFKLSQFLFFGLKPLLFSLFFIDVLLGLFKNSLLDLIIFFIKLNKLLLDKSPFKVQLFYLLFYNLSHQINFL